MRETHKLLLKDFVNRVKDSRIQFKVFYAFKKVTVFNFKTQKKFLGRIWVESFPSCDIFIQFCI